MPATPTVSPPVPKQRPSMTARRLSARSPLQETETGTHILVQRPRIFDNPRHKPPHVAMVGTRRLDGSAVIDVLGALPEDRVLKTDRRQRAEKDLVPE